MPKGFSPNIRFEGGKSEEYNFSQMAFRIANTGVSLAGFSLWID
jgi:hypothetical protein